MIKQDSTRPEQASADQLALPEAIATGVEAVRVFAPFEFVNDMGGEQRLVTRAAGRVLALPRPHPLRIPARQGSSIEPVTNRIDQSCDHRDGTRLTGHRPSEYRSIDLALPTDAMIYARKRRS